MLLNGLPPRTSPYAPIFPREDGEDVDDQGLHATPPIATLPCVACIGRRDWCYQYSTLGMRSLYGRLTHFEHDGGHETAKDAGLNKQVASAVWRALGYAPPSK